jgi:hypothetical protein
VEDLAGHKPGRPFRFAASWIAVVVEWVTAKAPREFGFLRSRWCCEAVAAIAALGLLFYAALMPETRGLKKAPQVGQI